MAPTDQQESKHMSERLYFGLNEPLPVSKLEGGPEINTERRVSLPLLNIEILKMSHEKCRACDISKDRKCAVFSVGNTDVIIMLVGEAPGKSENNPVLNSLKSPFIGKAGEKLDSMLTKVGKTRQEFYITNAVKCWPYGNATPKREEIDQCSGFLRDEIRLVRPRVIIALGDTAARALTNHRSKSIVSSSKKNWFINRIPILITYHPAGVLRTPSYENHVVETLKKALEMVE